MPPIFTLVVNTGVGLSGRPTGYVSPIALSVAAGIGLQPVPTLVNNRSVRLTVSSGLSLAGVPVVANARYIPLSVSAGLGLKPVPTLAHTSVINVSVSTGLGLQGVATTTGQFIRNLSVSTGLGLTQQLAMTSSGVHYLQVSAGVGLRPAPTTNFTRLVSVSAGLGISASPTAAGVRVLSVSAGLGISGVPTSGREIVLSVTAGLGLAGTGNPQNAIDILSLTAHLAFSVHAQATTGPLLMATGLGFQALVSCIVIVDPGTGPPELVGGPSRPLLRGISGTFPFTFAETSAGIVLMANGVDPMVRWDGLSQSADFAGVQAPTTAPTLGASGLGVITGLRYAFCRFVDRYGNPSNLSPISVGVQCGRDQSIDDIALDATGAATIESRSHGLQNGTTVILQGILGLPMNGTFAITVIDDDHFRIRNLVMLPQAGPLNPSATSGTWLGGGSWTSGASALAYTGLPTSSQSSVSTLQVFRNLEGNLDAVYLDATLALGTTATTSTLTDDVLAARQSLSIRTPEGVLLAYRYSLPPSNRPNVINYLGRIFAAGDTIVYAGCVSTISGTNTIQGIGTAWTDALIGRQIYVRGCSRPYGISAVSSTTQVLTLTASSTDPSSSFATYYIRSAPSERKILQWSEPDNPEAWPPWNALGLPENNDEITGLFVKGTYLYITERRHVWRFQYSDDPAASGHVFLALDQRGCVNQRCMVQADDTVYLLDESGIYSFDGSGIDAISDPVQVVFYADGLTYTPQVDWTADRTLWHASLDPTRTIIRWFVSMVGDSPADQLKTCLAYNYRLRRWWIESYPVAISSSCTATLADSANAAISSGSRRAIVGAECRTVLALGESALDLATGEGTLSGTATSSTSVSLTDSQALFSTSLPGARVYLTSGLGRGQSSIISSVSDDLSTLTVVTPWTTLPDTTSTYQIGGVPWQWRSGWLDVEDNETDTTRDLVISFQQTTAQTLLAAKLYYDHSPCPEIWGFDQSLDGVSVNEGSPEIWVDMSATEVLPGYRVFRQAQHSERHGYNNRFIQIGLSGVSSSEVVRVYQVSIRGVDQEGV